VLLYELLTGCTPFDANTLFEAGLDRMRKIIREQEPRRPSTRLIEMVKTQQTTIAHSRGSEAPRLVKTVRGDLDWIAMKCLDKDRARRYETANGLAMDLERYLGSKPVVARPPSATYRLRKMVQRNKLAFAATSAVALALILGVTASVWQAMRAMKSERLATHQRVRAEQEAQRADLNAEAEKEQREKAEAEAQKARDVLEFIQRMFGRVGDIYADKVTVVQMLDWNSADVKKKFKDQPDVSASVQYSLGYCYSRLGNGIRLRNSCPPRWNCTLVWSATRIQTRWTVPVNLPRLCCPKTEAQKHLICASE
jgi:eukaryotic-like serine/threonine-protein kinase